jgi:peptidoglycan/xylan/chitin deacetylase (PgdA/CDA1 family)
MNNCKIVMYHYVRPLKKSSHPEIKALELDGFIRQINYFKKNFHFLSAQEILDSIYSKNNLPLNSIVLTFDDGFKDHFLYVYPILKKLNIPALFFPPAKPIEENIVLDVHKIHFILANIKNKIDIVNEIFSFIWMNQKKFNLKNPKYYFDNIKIDNRYDTKEIVFIKRMLQRELPLQLRTEITHNLFKKFVTNNEYTFSKNLYLSLSEIKEMTDSGFYFSSHSYSHNWLSKLNQIELKCEIKKSVDFCKKMGQKNDLIMCYPYGDYNLEVIEEIQKNGFKAALTTKVGDSLMDIANAFTLKRFDTNDFPQ